MKVEVSNWQQKFPQKKITKDMSLYLLLLRLCVNTHARINSVQFSTITFWLILHIILESQAAELPRIIENTSWNRQNLSPRIATTQVCDSTGYSLKAAPIVSDLTSSSCSRAVQPAGIEKSERNAV
jgi:hypothetical protein